jgi:hypothetical protein
VEVVEEEEAVVVPVCGSNVEDQVGLALPRAVREHALLSMSGITSVSKGTHCPETLQLGPASSQRVI